MNVFEKVEDRNSGFEVFFDRFYSNFVIEETVENWRKYFRNPNRFERYVEALRIRETKDYKRFD